MYHEESIRLKWARFIKKLKHLASGNSAKEKHRAPGFHEAKKIMEGPGWAFPVCGTPLAGERRAMESRVVFTFRLSVTSEK